MIKLTNYNLDAFPSILNIEEKSIFPFVQYVITKKITVEIHKY